ncbi:MAG: RecQ family ATP-dependent DNA helicase [Spirochaetaceae bacterium]|jgi:ATP-dependent DNA helicase RecQ|nr:RecQ family ATP-dependent DNA helicase [Spirochaetaceae bacterium]
MDDPLGNAVKRLFNLSYLFPYQRLVITNILEAAEAAGMKVLWPELPDQEEFGMTETRPANGEEDGGADPESPEPEERGSLGRQIVILPTGAGKSLCFQLPAMLLEGPTLVIYPILSLMADQERRLRERGFEPVLLRGGQSAEERQEIWDKVGSGKGRFIIANPEVLLSPQVMGKLKGLKIIHVVIDEAHCVSEWGESFRPSYLRIREIIEAVQEEDILPLVTAFTATASAPVLEKIGTYVFGGTGAHRIVGNPDRSNIRYAALGCMLRNPTVRDLIRKNERPAIVFCSSRPGTQNLARYLRNELGDPEIRFYHAGLSREEKTETENWFFKSPRGILVSTCAYGMGVDKANIRTVIHRDCPPSVEAYLQESGRAGRDGLLSQAILLWGPDDESALRRAKAPADQARLLDLMAYAKNTGSCRRQALLGLLNYEGGGESPESACCDVCEGRARGELREEAALLDFFRKNSRRYNFTEAAEILSQTALSWSDDEAKQAVKILLRDQKIRRIKIFLWKDKLTLWTVKR